jgi:2-polyprenyl-6-hydroxyphenyl methylase/3-demethylubiquinone-9 3-methyltransferase
MINPEPNPDWPESWLLSHAYDQQEVFGGKAWPGYTNAYRHRQKATLDLLQEVVPPGARVLDVAAAQGNFTLKLAELGYQMVWNDLRAELAGYVQLKQERGQVEYCPGNVFELGFQAEFDAVIITEIIEHVAHPDEFLGKIGTMVKPGGRIIMTTPNGAHLMNRLPRFSDCADPSVFEAMQFQPNGDGHVFLLWPDEVEALGQKAGLKMEAHTVFTTPWANGRHKTEWVLKRLPVKMIDWLEVLADKLPEKVREKLMIHAATRYRKPF